MRLKMTALAIVLALPTGLSAQEMVNPGIWGTGLLGQSAMDNARENTRRSRQSRTLPQCTENHVPRAEYRRMETEFGNRVRADGRASADRWSRQQSDAWYQRLRSQGVCR